MKSPLLILDVSCLAWRAFHTTGDLSFAGIQTGVVYGMFRAVMDLMEVHATNQVVWCFDGGYGMRTSIYPTYKATRHTDDDPEKAEGRRILRSQIDRLQTDYLSRIGFRNVFIQQDYEADDVIASVCRELPPGEKAIVVSTDEDLFQLLRDDQVFLWNPIAKTLITAEAFRAKWGMFPVNWPVVKAIAGCRSDNVVGVRGVGEKTATRFLTGQLKHSSKAFDSIVSQADMWRKNLELVRLPFAGVRSFPVVEDGLIDFGPVLAELGMDSLRGKGRVRT